VLQPWLCDWYGRWERLTGDHGLKLQDASPGARPRGLDEPVRHDRRRLRPV
jgi:hypothetical protein